MTGEAIELIGDEEERKKVLAAIKAGVGTTAATYLYENKVTDKNGNSRYFIGVFDDGPSEMFAVGMEPGTDGAEDAETLASHSRPWENV